MDFRYARPPPQAPPSSDPHQPLPQPPVPPPPGTWYPGQFQYHSPSPPPPHWPPHPPHSGHRLPPPPPPHPAAHPQPMPYASNQYSVHPRPHMLPPPSQPHYPPVNQEWSNPGWGHQGWDYSAHNKNEDDWAARAKAWAASKAVTDNQHPHTQSGPANPPNEINHQNQYSQNMDYQQHSHPPSSYQQFPSSYALPPRPPANYLQDPSSFSSGYAPDGQYTYPVSDGSLRDPPGVYPRHETTPTTLSVHQQEVPSSYSSVAELEPTTVNNSVGDISLNPGKEEQSDMNRNFYQQSHVAFASAPQHQVPPPNERPSSVEQPHYPFNNSSAESATDLSNQPLDFGPRYGHDHGSFGQSGVPGMSYSSLPSVHTTIQQTDPSVGVTSPVSMHSTPLFGRMSSFQPTIPSANTTFLPTGVSNAFHGDAYGTPGFPDRPKKASVPNWLREELIKKKPVIGSSAPEVARLDTESNEDEDTDMNRDQVDGKSIESTRSTEEEGDDEDYVEAARTAAVNREIKHILTEVLSKVTDELFDEIATKVLEEDDLNVEVERKVDNTSAAITPKSTVKVIIPLKTTGADVDDAAGKSSSIIPGDVLGLGSYASDDDDEEEEEKQVQNSSVPSSDSNKPPVHLSENGSSQVDDGDAHGEKVQEESDSHKVSPKEAIEPHNNKSGEEKVKADNSDFSKSKQSVIEGGLEGKTSLPDDSKGRVPKTEPVMSRAHDERHVNRAKKEELNGSKEKVNDQDLRKKDIKAEVKDDKEEREKDRRSRDKESNRKPEHEKDNKNERSKYKSGDNSSRHRRHRTPSPHGRGRGSKDSSSVSHARGSGDSSSDDSRRKVHSRRRVSSPSPVRSRRQVSRSPPSKHSHRRHSIYPSLEATRERRRSRSRSRSRSRRG